MADIKQLCDSLREQVDATINPDNGLKSITGASTRLMFLSTIDAIEEAAKTGGGGGGGAEIVYVTTSQISAPLTEEQINANIAVWQKAKDAYDQNKTIPTIVFDLSSAFAALMGANMAYIVSPIQVMGGMDAETGESFGLAAFALDYMGKMYGVELAEDGIAVYQSMS